VEVIRPLPAQLTDPIQYPETGGYTVEDMVALLLEMYAIIDRANEDRAAAKRLTDVEVAGESDR
jgi:hypothetical protein